MTRLLCFGSLCACFLLTTGNAQARVIHPASTATHPLHVASFHASAEQFPGASANSPTWNLAALEARRSINPARFDHWHPVLGPVLGEISRLQAGLCPKPNALVDSYLTRYALDPAKFTQMHPRFAPILADDVRLRAAVCDCLPLNGVLPDTPFINALRLQRSLNPTKFDKQHPNLGKLLAEDQLLRSMPHDCPPGTGPSGGQVGPPVSPPPSGTPGGSTGGGGPPAPPAAPGPVPEPASVVLLLLGLILAGPRALRSFRKPAI